LANIHTIFLVNVRCGYFLIDFCMNYFSINKKNVIFHQSWSTFFLIG